MNNTSPCLNKATKTLDSSSTLNLKDIINEDMNDGPNLISLTDENKNSELNNKRISDHVLSHAQKYLAAKVKPTKASKTKASTRESFLTPDDPSTPPDTEGRVTAVVAKVKYTATKIQARWTFKHPGRHCTSNNIIKVLLGSGSDGDLWFHKKETPMHFLHLTRQVPLSWHTSNGSFLTKGRRQVILNFFEYSNSWEYTVTLML